MRVILGLLLTAAAVWLGGYGCRSLGGVRIVTAAEETWVETVPVRGVVLREEQTLEGDPPALRVIARPGRVAAGEVLALAAPVRDGLLRSLRLRELEAALRLEEREKEKTDPAERAGAVRSAASSCTGALARRDRADERSEAARLRALLWGGEVWTEGEAAALSALADMDRATAEAREITAERSGYFCPVPGPAALDPAERERLDGAALAARMEEEGETAGWGRLVTAERWYLAMPLPEAAPAVGETAMLCADGRETEMRVERAGEGVLILSSDRVRPGVPDGSALEGELRWGEVTGLRLPEEAVRRDGAGCCVLLERRGEAVRAEARVLRERDGLVLVQGESLREGCRVIVGGRDLGDGSPL